MIPSFFNILKNRAVNNLHSACTRVPKSTPKARGRGKGSRLTRRISRCPCLGLQHRNQGGVALKLSSQVKRRGTVLVGHIHRRPGTAEQSPAMFGWPLKFVNNQNKTKQLGEGGDGVPEQGGGCGAGSNRARPTATRPKTDANPRTFALLPATATWSGVSP